MGAAFGWLKLFVFSGRSLVVMAWRTVPRTRDSVISVVGIGTHTPKKVCTWASRGCEAARRGPEPSRYKQCCGGGPELSATNDAGCQAGPLQTADVAPTAYACVQRMMTMLF